MNAEAEEKLRKILATGKAYVSDDVWQALAGESVRGPVFALPGCKIIRCRWLPPLTIASFEMIEPPFAEQVLRNLPTTQTPPELAPAGESEAAAALRLQVRMRGRS